MIRVALLADDLTGALDSAAQFASPGAAIPVWWPPLPDLQAPFGIDTRTRELAPAEAAAHVTEFAPFLSHAPLAFKKIDSLLRGPIAAELTALLQTAPFDRCILAPALPFHGRVTRRGRQYVVAPDTEPRLVGPDLGNELRHIGKVTVADAETDADLVEIARAGLLSGDRILWCGTAGLAAALAGDPPPVPLFESGEPLAIIGSAHPVSLEQLDAAAEAGIPVITLDHPPGTSRAQASAALAQYLARLVPGLTLPARIVVSGGETLAHLCSALEASRLEVEGELLPGVPVSRFHDGRWQGTQVISKSGAFGGRQLLCDLLRSA